MKKTTLFFIILLGLIVPNAQADKKPLNLDGEQQAKVDIRGTEESPLVVNSHPIQTKEEASKETDRDAEQRRTNRWSIGLTFAIAAFAGLQILVYLKQTKIMRDTLDTIAKQAVMMESQVAIQQESLRPRLAIGSFSGNAYNSMASGKFVFLNTELENSGGIPAYGVIVETWIEWLARPFEFTSNAKYHKSKPMAVDRKNPTMYSIPLGRQLTTYEISDLRQAKATVCVRIRLTYNAFGAEVHTQEAFSTQPRQMMSIPEYSSAT